MMFERMADAAGKISARLIGRPLAESSPRRKGCGRERIFPAIFDGQPPAENGEQPESYSRRRLRLRGIVIARAAPKNPANIARNRRSARGACRL